MIFRRRNKFGLETFIYSVQFSSVAQSCTTLCNPMDCRTPGFLVHLQLLELGKKVLKEAAKSKEELKSPLMKVKEESEKVG